MFLTGSDTSANALFGNLQVVTANALGLNPVLTASVDSAAGVMGKMISLPSIAVAVARRAWRRPTRASCSASRSSTAFCCARDRLHLDDVRLHVPAVDADRAAEVARATRATRARESSVVGRQSSVQVSSRQFDAH